MTWRKIELKEEAQLILSETLALEVAMDIS